MAEQFHPVASTGDVGPGEMISVEVGGKTIALYNLDGKVYATSDICTHAYACLSDGYIDGENIECPLHQGLFHIPTGKAVAAPASEDLKTYPVKLDGGAVYIEV